MAETGGDNGDTCEVSPTTDAVHASAMLQVKSQSSTVLGVSAQTSPSMGYITGIGLAESRACLPEGLQELHLQSLRRHAALLALARGQTKIPTEPFPPGSFSLGKVSRNTQNTHNRDPTGGMSGGMSGGYDDYDDDSSSSQSGSQSDEDLGLGVLITAAEGKVSTLEDGVDNIRNAIAEIVEFCSDELGESAMMLLEGLRDQAQGGRGVQH